MSLEKPEKLINDLEFLRKLSTMKVLIVDDQKNMVKTIENMLVGICAFTRKSQSISRAYNGLEATRTLFSQPGLTHHIDLVFLDWNMPGMPGIEVIRAVRSSEFRFVKDVPVIMITGESRMHDVNEALYSGVDDYLLKPFVADNVRTRMNPLLRRYWSGLKIRRASNRRSETRYPADGLGMKVSVEFLNGLKADAEVINIARNSLRVELENPKSFETKCFFIRPIGAEEGRDIRMDCVSLVPSAEERGKAGRIQMVFILKYGFGDQAGEKCWLEWIGEAKRKYALYRGKML